MSPAPARSDTEQPRLRRRELLLGEDARVAHLAELLELLEVDGGAAARAPAAVGVLLLRASIACASAWTSASCSACLSAWRPAWTAETLFETCVAVPAMTAVRATVPSTPGPRRLILMSDSSSAE